MQSGYYTILLLSALVYSNPSVGKVYKRVDESGRTYYSDKPFEEDKKQKVLDIDTTKRKAKVSRYDTQQARQAREIANYQAGQNAYNAKKAAYLKQQSAIMKKVQQEERNKAIAAKQAAASAANARQRNENYQQQQQNQAQTNAGRVK